jgi:hypothetical protein
MYWFWLNIPLAAAFVAAWTGIPLWLVLRHPDADPRAAGPRAAAAGPRAAAAGPRAAAAGHWEPSSDGRPQIPDRVLAR